MHGSPASRRESGFYRCCCGIEGSPHQSIPVIRVRVESSQPQLRDLYRRDGLRDRIRGVCGCGVPLIRRTQLIERPCRKVAGEPGRNRLGARGRLRGQTRRCDLSVPTQQVVVVEIPSANVVFGGQMMIDPPRPLPVIRKFRRRVGREPGESERSMPAVTATLPRDLSG
jgi:hypothetical protein